MSVKILPKEITSYDLLKAFAVVTMIADHVGYYFFPDDLWWRAVGRLSAPVWFFLIGYAQSRDLGPKLWAGLGILVMANFVTGMALFPLNILATMIFIRIVIDHVMVRVTKDHEVLAVITIILFILIPFFSFAWEYGTAGLLLAMFGWLMRHPEKTAYRMRGTVETFIVAVFTGYVLYQCLNFGLQRDHIAFLVPAMAAVFFALYKFKPMTFPDLGDSLPSPLVWSVQMMGRRTLEIYVIHLIVLKFAALLFMDDERFAWFRFALLPFELDAL